MAKEIENPCISVCQLSGDLCVSCGRNKEDIRKWKRMKRPEKNGRCAKGECALKGIEESTWIAIPPELKPLQF